MKVHKSKSHLEISDASAMKDQLGSVLREIVAFTERLEEAKTTSSKSEFGYARCFDYDMRVQDLKSKLHPGKDPAKPVIFLARMVIECLSKGSMSEKDIKNAVLDRCKEAGIKSSNRGLIAGTGMDVATVCNVLGVLGALEQLAVESSAAVKAEASNASTAQLGIAPPSFTATAALVVYCDPQTITGPGAELYKVLSERWHPRLTEYFEDALKHKQAIMNSDNASAVTTKTEASSSSAGGSVGGGAVAPRNSSSAPPTAVVPSGAPALAPAPVPSPAVPIVSTVPAAVPVVPVVPQMSHTARLIAEYRSGNTENLNARAHLKAHANNANGASQKSLDTYFAPAAKANAAIATSANHTAPVTASLATAVPSSSSSAATVAAGSNNSSTGVVIAATATVVAAAAGVPSRAPSLAPPETSSALSAAAASAVAGLLALDNKVAGPANGNGAADNNKNIKNSSNSAIGGTLHDEASSSNSTAQAPSSGAPLHSSPTLQQIPNRPNAYNSSNVADHSGSNNLPCPAGGALAAPGFLSGVPGISSAGALNTDVNGISNTYPTQGNMALSYNNNNGVPAASSSSAVTGIALVSSPSGSLGNSIGSGLNLTNVPTAAARQPPPNIQPFVSPLSVSMGDLAAQAVPAHGPAPAPQTGKGTGKAKAKPVAAAEKKPTKKSLKEAATAQAASAAATATANANKARRGPSAMRVWRIRADFAACYNSISSSMSGHNSHHSNSATNSVMHSTHSIGASGMSTAIASNSHQSAGHHQHLTAAAGAGTSSSASSSSSAANALAKSESNKSPALKLLTDPARALQAAALAQYEYSAALELEEKLLRRLAGQCNLSLKPTRYRVGTSYLSADPDIMSQPVGNRFWQQQNALSSNASLHSSKANGSGKFNASDSGDDYFKCQDDEEIESNYAVFDEKVSITAAYLLEKVRRSKRQRGDILYGNITLPVSHSLTAAANAARAAAAASVGVFSAAHVHSLSAVCNKTAEFFWHTGPPGSPRTPSSKQKKGPPAKTSVNEPITMAQYARNLHVGATGPSPVVLSSCSNGSSITAHTLRRYAQPLDLVGGNLPMLDISQSATIFAAATGGAHNANATYSSSSSNNKAHLASNNGSDVLRIPDLTLRTREIAWAEIAKEFQVLPPPTEDLAPGLVCALQNDAAPEPPKEKKRKYLQNHDSSASSSSHASTGKLAAEGLISVEVLAPQFKEIVPITTVAQSLQADGVVPEDTSDDEDISDQAVAVRHEAVLKAMRDKWNRLQQLKNEALYGPGGVPPEGTRGGNYRGGGGYGYFIGGRPAASRSASVTLGASGEGAADGGAGGGDEGAAVAQGLQSALTLPVGSSTSAGIGAVGSAATQFQNLSPRKRGLASAHAKRRGRPPKAAKTHHHSHSSAKHALNNSYSRSSSSNIANNSSAVVDSCGANYSESADLNDAYEQFDPHDESDDY